MKHKIWRQPRCQRGEKKQKYEVKRSENKRRYEMKETKRHKGEAKDSGILTPKEKCSAWQDPRNYGTKCDFLPRCSANSANFKFYKTL